MTYIFNQFRNVYWQEFMTSEDLTTLRGQLENLKSGIRDIAHDISSPLGVIRMAAFYLQTAKPDQAKREHYYSLIGDTVDKVEVGLKKLRALGEDPSLDIHSRKVGETKP